MEIDGKAIDWASVRHSRAGRHSFDLIHLGWLGKFLSFVGFAAVAWEATKFRLHEGQKHRPILCLYYVTPVFFLGPCRKTGQGEVARIELIAGRRVTSLFFNFFDVYAPNN